MPQLVVEVVTRDAEVGSFEALGIAVVRATADVAGAAVVADGELGGMPVGSSVSVVHVAAAADEVLREAEGAAAVAAVGMARGVAHPAPITITSAAA